MWRGVLCPLRTGHPEPRKNNAIERKAHARPGQQPKTMNIKTNIRTAMALAVACSVLLGCKYSTPQTTAKRAASEYPLAAKIAQRDGTNYIGVYLGMIAEHDGRGGVMMYSATSGEWLRWISLAEFRDVYVLKTKPEYRRTDA